MGGHQERIHGGYSGDERPLAYIQHLQQVNDSKNFGCALPSLVLPFSSLIMLPSNQF